MKNFDIYYDHDFFPNKIYFVLIRLSLSKRLRVKKKSEIMISEKKTETINAIEKGTKSQLNK